MKAIICDCCHRVIEANEKRIENNLVIIHKDNENVGTSLDFCDDCMQMIYVHAQDAVMKIKKGAQFSTLTGKPI